MSCSIKQHFTTDVKAVKQVFLHNEFFQNFKEEKKKISE
jgi:hypothetical protein